MYVKRSRTGRIIMVPVYVDDIPSAHHPADNLEWEELKAKFFARFAIKFLGEADWLLNMRITRDRPNRLLWLDQTAYIERMLEDFGMDNCIPLPHPGAPEELTKAGCPTDPEEIERMRRIPYRRAIGCLTYLNNTSRMDFSFPLNRAAQFSQNPGAVHWNAVKAILRYLCGTAKLALLFDGRPEGNSQSPGLTVFTDASWANCTDDRRSTTGWLIRLGRCWIDWNCRKQATIALSSCESEYMAIGSGTTGVMWTMKLLTEMGLLGEVFGATAKPCIPILLTDSKSAIALAKNDVHHDRTKHIDIRHHFIRDEIEKETIILQWIPSGEQIADILTKTLPPRLFLKFQAQLVGPRDGQNRQ